MSSSRPSTPAGPLERGVARLARALSGPARSILSLAQVRSRLHDRALSAWRATDAPLILCHGNINRSAFAEALARRRPGSHAASGGFYPQPGRTSPERTVALAERYGVDLRPHRSAEVSGEELAAAPAIFVFDLENVARVAARRPGALARTHLLGALSARGDVIIEDPHGRGEEVLEQVLSRIAEAIAAGDESR